MCGGGGGDGGAAQARADQQAQQARITQGRQNIDDTFNSTYTDPYFQNITDNYDSYYNPQVDKQYGDAQNKLTFDLGRQGILGSSEASRQLGNLQDQYNLDKTNIANQGLQAATTARSNVSAEQNQLYNINNSSADPAAAAASAKQALSSINTQPSLTSLGDLFSTFINQSVAPAATIAAAQSRVPLAGFNFNTPSNATSVVQ